MKVNLIGIGPGERSMLTQQAARAIAQSTSLIGAQRMLDQLDQLDLAGKATFVSSSPDEIAGYLDKLPDTGSAAVLVSGDLGFYSIASQLRETLSEHEVFCICGISSLQYFAAKIGTSWEDMAIVSLHGRHGNVAASAFHNKKTFVLTGGTTLANHVCVMLCDAGLGNLQVTVGENLSYFSERIITAPAKKLRTEPFDSLAVMLIENPSPGMWLPGLPDSAFIRGDTPMTKSEVRAVALSKLRPTRYETVYDIGAGTGSVAVELAIAAHSGEVYAIERNQSAIALIEKNKGKFGAQNLHIISGEAPDALADLPAPDCAFIGGCGGRLRDTMEVLLDKNPAVRIVISAITIETLTQAVMYVSSLGMADVDVVQLSVSRSKSAGHSHMMIANNPVTLVYARGSDTV